MKLDRVLHLAMAALLGAAALSGCSSNGDDQLVVPESSTSTAVSTDSPDSLAPEELPTAYWPDEPEVGVWYRLDMLDVEQCGYQTLTLPEDTIDTEVFYFNQDADVITLRPQLFDRSLANTNHLPGYGRLNAGGSIDFSGDTVNAIVSYEPTPAETVNELADWCE